MAKIIFKKWGCKFGDAVKRLIGGWWVVFYAELIYADLILKLQFN
jgi:hypothetical protein